MNLGKKILGLYKSFVGGILFRSTIESGNVSDIKISNIGIFEDLLHTIEKVEQKSPNLITSIMQLIDQLRQDVLTDLSETQMVLKKNAIQGKGQGAQGDALNSNQQDVDNSKHQQGLHELQNSVATLDHLTARLKRTQQAYAVMLEQCAEAKAKLTAFDQIAKSYLGIGGSIQSGLQSNLTSGYGNGSAFDFGEIREVGDTFHISKSNKNQINQMFIDALEGKFQRSESKANKISIDNISQLDFKILEDNGFEIHKIAPNKYSAFKINSHV